jgi:hypothetical protein
MRIRNAQTTRLGWICIVDIIEQSRPADLRNVTRNVWFYDQRRNKWQREEDAAQRDGYLFEVSSLEYKTRMRRLYMASPPDSLQEQTAHESGNSSEQSTTKRNNTSSCGGRLGWRSRRTARRAA